jgi:AcrR family transcriptional regulator
MPKRINDTEVRKKQILEKASALFLEKGYAGVGIDEIAAACGVVRGTILRYFHSKKELYDAILFGRGNHAGTILGEYCEDRSIPVTDIIKKLLLVTEAQFAEVITAYREKLKNEEFRQNFDVFRLPIFRNEAKMLEKILLRGNEEGVWNIRDPHMRAHSYIFAMFGLAEAPEADTENLKQEIREVTKAMLQIEIPEENEEGE